jgi:hypothetical protein
MLVQYDDDKSRLRPSLYREEFVGLPAPFLLPSKKGMSLKVDRALINSRIESE